MYDLEGKQMKNGKETFIVKITLPTSSLDSDQNENKVSFNPTSFYPSQLGKSHSSAVQSCLKSDKNY